MNRKKKAVALDLAFSLFTKKGNKKDDDDVSLSLKGFIKIIDVKNIFYAKTLYIFYIEILSEENYHFSMIRIKKISLGILNCHKYMSFKKILSNL